MYVRFEAVKKNSRGMAPGVFALANGLAHSGAQCWFKLGGDAEHLLVRTRGYLELLDRYGVRWVERRSGSPGPVLYEDKYQIVIDAKGPVEAGSAGS